MYSARLRYRVDCVAQSSAILPKHTLRFHKKGSDGSAKCDAFFTDVEADRVIGVLFDIPEAEKRKLDAAEGLGKGYNEKHVNVLTPDGSLRDAFLYVADRAAMDERIRPYSWYRDFVISGATEHSLPPDYIGAYILPVQATKDPDAGRDKRERAKIKAESVSTRDASLLREPRDRDRQSSTDRRRF